MSNIIHFTDEKYFNLDTQQLYIENKPIGKPLTGIPFRILNYLATNSSIPLSEEQIRQNCWKEDTGNGSVAYHIMTLRKAIKDEREPGTKKYRYIGEVDGKYYCSYKIISEQENHINFSSTSESKSTPDFFHKYLDLHNKGKIKIEEVSIAFFGGTRWLTNTDGNKRNAILREIRELNINCNVMINGISSAIETVHTHMKNEQNPLAPKYLSVLDGIKQWYEYQKVCPKIKVRISLLPLLHSYYHIKLADNKSESGIRVLFYTYGNEDLGKCYIKIFNGESPFYDLYCDEFKFLWEKGISIDEYLKGIEGDKA